MEKILLINNKEFRYQEEYITHETIKPLDVEDGIKLLKTTNELLNERHIFYSLAFGTLLGAVRDHGIIAGDEDMDIFIFDEKALYESLPYLDQNGLHLIRIIEGKLYSFSLQGGAYIDMYIVGKISRSFWSLYCYRVIDWYMPKKFFRHFETINFLGIDTKCPRNPERLLAFWYGSTWRTPVRGHKFRYEVSSHYHWTRSVLPRLNKLFPFLFAKEK